MTFLLPPSQQVKEFLDLVTGAGGLRLQYTITEARSAGREAEPSQLAPDASSDTAGPLVLSVLFTGPDTPLLVARGAELLLALEHVAAKILRLEPEQHETISFDAESFKADRERELAAGAEIGVDHVRSTGTPFVFPPMSSRERRMLHLLLAPSGLRSASTGEGHRRSVVLYPDGGSPTNSPSSSAPSDEQAQRVRQAFRRR